MKKLLLLAIALLSLGTLAYADTFVTYTSRAQQNPSDIIDWGAVAPPGTIVPAFASTTFDGVPYAVESMSGSVVTMQEGNTWIGNFDYGESLLWTGNANFGVAGGPMAVLFGAGVGSFGFSLSADLYGPFTAQIGVFDTSLNLIGTFTYTGKSNGLENGSARFIGIGDKSGANIGAVEILTDSGNPTYVNDYAIDDVSLTYTKATPEPGSLLLLGSGLAGVLGVIRRKLSL